MDMIYILMVTVLPNFIYDAKLGHMLHIHHINGIHDIDHREYDLLSLTNVLKNKFIFFFDLPMDSFEIENKP